MSPAGQAFLECAFAPPDFNTDPGRGIPDRYDGKSLGAKHQYTGNLALSANTDTYIVVLPTPGVAYWTFSVAAGTRITSSNAQLNPQLYDDFASLFGDTSSGGNLRTSNVEAFRYASTAIGLYPTSNLMQFAGSISIWKAPIKQATESRLMKVSATANATTSVDTIVLSGLEALTAVGRENYTESFIKGAYTISTCNQPEFEFQPILEGVAQVPQTVSGYDGVATVSNMFGSLLTSVNQVYLGMGDMDAIFVKISTPTGATNNLVIKTWACVEYRPQPASVLYQYAGNSPPYDPIALDAYRRIARQLPTAVECAKNAEFWNRVKSIMRGFLRAASADLS